MTKAQAKDAVAALVAKFQHNLADYKQASYNETLTRIDFINPFFEALGWDMTNRQGLPENLREVIHEDKLDIKGRKKAPDYSFRLPNGRVERKFFLEAKKPAVNLAGDISPAYQVRLYGWNASLPLSALTDFEELAVYDCRVRPYPQDKTTVARIAYFTCPQYPDRFDEIYDLFSKEAVAAGSLDQFIVETGLKRGLTPVDAEFLKEIEGWRDSLAKTIALRNPAFSVYDLNFAVQRTIDRIIFLRMAEDRKIEPYEQLLHLAERPGIYPRLVNLYRQADAKYNAGLFNLTASADGDSLTPAMQLNDAPLKQIITGLYPSKSPYEFSVMGADILGNVYEQFLGKVIRLTAGHRAKVEEKPEVKKAGGVFYTPTYIVEAIVKQTLGPLVEGKTPAQISPLRILDAACGSGSFLIGAYQFLLDYHLTWYMANSPEKHKKAVVWIPQTLTPTLPLTRGGQGGGWHLTIAEKKRILLNNIYGVDIDRQAVNVTQLNLLLKALEGETDQTLQLSMFQERVLPQLSNNIKCGNSLIDDTFYASGQATMFPEESLLRRVNAFDWAAEFPAIFSPLPTPTPTLPLQGGGGSLSSPSSEGEGRGGGFDAIIGNPPYIRIQVMTEWAPEEVAYYKGRYAAAGKGNYDIYVIFVEKGLSLLKAGGRLGFILPHKFFNAKYGEPLRRLLAEGKHLTEIIHFGDQQVFANGTTYTCLLFLEKAGRDSFHFVKAHNLAAWRRAEPQPEGDLPAPPVTASEWNFTVGSGSALFDRLSQMPVKLGDVAERMAQGIRTSANEVYVLDLVSEDGPLVQAKSKQLDRVVTLERRSLSSFLQGREIKSYRILHSGKVVIIPYRVQNKQAQFIPEKELKQEYPNTYAYLKENKTYLENRERGRMRGPNWYAYVYPKNIEIMATPKLLVPDIADRAAFAFDMSGEYAFTSGYGITLKKSTPENPLYILGLFNSKVLDFYLKQISTTLRGGFFRYFTQFIEQLPIRTIDFANPAEVKQHDEMVWSGWSSTCWPCTKRSLRPKTRRISSSTSAKSPRRIRQLIGWCIACIISVRKRSGLWRAAADEITQSRAGCCGYC